MSHTLQKVNVGNNALAVVKIVDYAQGGESFTLAELGLTGSLTNVLFIGVDAHPTVMTVTPRLVATKVQLGQQTGSSEWGEIPSTLGINFVFSAIVQGVN